MTSRVFASPSVPTPQNLIRLALGAAQSEAAGLDAAERALMVSAVQMDAIERLTSAQRGSVLARALMSPYPPGFFQALRDCAGLKRLLPELDALFGVPRRTGAPVPADAGEQQLRVLAQSARRNAPTAIRFAALIHRIGMGATPPVLWPSHPGHQACGQSMLPALARRIALPDDALDLARLAMAECECVHRAGDMSDGAIAELLGRVGARLRPVRFDQLMEVCLCDYTAHAGHAGQGEPAYAKAIARALRPESEGRP